MTPPTPPVKERTVMVMLTVPPTMVHNDQATIERKLRENVNILIPFLAAEMYRCLQEPNTSPELLLARAAAQVKRVEREERRGIPSRMDPQGAPARPDGQVGYAPVQHPGAPNQRCMFDTDGDGNCHVHPNGCPPGPGERP